MQAISIADVADELYSLSPAEFTAARDERARQARAAGQRDLSAEIKKLARPTASAWLVNQLARRAPDELAKLFEVSQALQEAQRTLAGDRLRELSGQRRQVVAELLPVAAGLAADAGQPASAAVLGEVRATLEAALADPQAGDAVRSGHLTKALAYAGLGEVDLSAALALPAEAASRAGRGQPRAASGEAGSASAARRLAAPSGTATGTAPGGKAPREKAATGEDDRGQLLAEAEAEAGDAQAVLDAAERRTAVLAEQRQFLGRRLDHLNRELAQAKAEDAQLAKDVKQAERDEAEAARGLASAQRRLALARKRVAAASD